MRKLCVQVGEEPYQVTLEVTSTDGQGLVCFLYGGTLPHVGGQALANPGPLLHGAQLSHVDLWVSTVPGHKDAEAASAVARRLCLATGQAVSVAAGIHVDNATSDEIKRLYQNCLDAADVAAEGLGSVA